MLHKHWLLLLLNSVFLWWRFSWVPKINIITTKWNKKFSAGFMGCRNWGCLCPHWQRCDLLTVSANEAKFKWNTLGLENQEGFKQVLSDVVPPSSPSGTWVGCFLGLLSLLKIVIFHSWYFKTLKSQKKKIYENPQCLFLLSPCISMPLHQVVFLVDVLLHA
jgi:hypothetical protein